MLERHWSVVPKQKQSMQPFGFSADKSNVLGLQTSQPAPATFSWNPVQSARDWPKRCWGRGCQTATPSKTDFRAAGIRATNLAGALSCGRVADFFCCTGCITSTAVAVRKTVEPSQAPVTLTSTNGFATSERGQLDKFETLLPSIECDLFIFIRVSWLRYFMNLWMMLFLWIHFYGFFMNDVIFMDPLDVNLQ